MIVPGHGHLCDIADVAYYRDMATIVRDRLQNAIKKGMTLNQIKAAKLTYDYDGIYGATTGFWTTDKFLEASYKSLTRRKRIQSEDRARENKWRCGNHRHRNLRSRLIASRKRFRTRRTRRWSSKRHGESHRARRSYRLLVSLVTEDWRYRMMTPALGDFPSVPVTPAARALANAWIPPRTKPRQSVQGLRSSEHPTHAGSSTHHLAGR